MLPTQVLANLNLTAYGLCRLGYWVPQMVGNRINAKSYCMAHILMLSVAGNSYPWRKLGYQIIANQNTINSILTSVGLCLKFVRRKRATVTEMIFFIFIFISNSQVWSKTGFFYHPCGVKRDE